MTKRRVKYLQELATDPEGRPSEKADAAGGDLERELLDTLCRLTVLLQYLHAAGDDESPPPHRLS